MALSPNPEAFRGFGGRLLAGRGPGGKRTHGQSYYTGGGDHGPSILNPAVYEALRDKKGMDKKSAAAISNAALSKKTIGGAWFKKGKHSKKPAKEPVTVAASENLTLQQFFDKKSYMAQYNAMKNGKQSKMDRAAGKAKQLPGDVRSPQLKAIQRKMGIGPYKPLKGGPHPDDATMSSSGLRKLPNRPHMGIREVGAKGIPIGPFGHTAKTGAAVPGKPGFVWKRGLLPNSHVAVRAKGAKGKSNSSRIAKATKTYQKKRPVPAPFKSKMKGPFTDDPGNTRFSEDLTLQQFFDKKSYMAQYNARHSGRAVPGGNRTAYAKELKQARRELGTGHNSLVRGVAKVRVEGNPVGKKVAKNWAKLRVNRAGGEFAPRPHKGGGSGFKHRTEDGTTYRASKGEARGAKKYYHAKNSAGRKLGIRTQLRGEARMVRKGIVSAEYNEPRLTLQQFFDKKAYMAQYNAKTKGGGRGRPAAAAKPAAGGKPSATPRADKRAADKAAYAKALGPHLDAKIGAAVAKIRGGSLPSVGAAKRGQRKLVKRADAAKAGGALGKAFANRRKAGNKPVRRLIDRERKVANIKAGKPSPTGNRRAAVANKNYRKSPAKARPKGGYSQKAGSARRMVDALPAGGEGYNEPRLTLQQFFDKKAYMAAYNAKKKGGGRGRPAAAAKPASAPTRGLGRLNRSKKITASNPSGASVARIARLGKKSGSLPTGTSKKGVLSYVRGFAKSRKRGSPAQLRLAQAANGGRVASVRSHVGVSGNPMGRKRQVAYQRGQGYDPRGPGAG